MPTTYTSLLGLALPATGELQGTWGTTVNDSITSLLDTAVAGTTTLSADTDVTLSSTTGASNQSRQAIILWTANGTVTRNITAPAHSKAYIVINQSAGTQSIVIRGVGPTTGVTIVKGEKAIVAWDGADFVKVATDSGAGTFTNVNVTGTTTLSGLTASTALALNASKEVISVTNTGTGDNVLATNATLITPNIGTPSSANLTNAIGLPISTGVSGLGTGIATALGVNVGLVGSPLINGGSLGTPSNGNLANAVGLPLTTGVTGTLPVGSGGTGITSGTSGGVPYYSASNTIASSSLLAANALVIGGGAGVAPSTTTTAANILTFLGNPTSANLAAAVTDETGTGLLVFNTNASFVTPDLGTPSAANLTNATNLPISTGVSGLGTNVATFLGSPSSANLAAAVTDETGTGLLVFNTNASLVTPNIGVPSFATLTNATGLPISTGVSGLGTNVAAALGNTTNANGGFLTTDGTATVTNKRLTLRVSSAVSISSPLAWNSDNFDQYVATAQAAPLTINADSGTPTDGQKIIFRFKDDGTARSLTWTTGVSNGFQAVGITLPTTTVIGKVTYVGAIYNANASRWDAVATVTQA